MAAARPSAAPASVRPRWRAIARMALALASATLVVPGCGPVLATREVAEAEVALEAARAARAEVLAVYEFTAADVTLTKAREEEGYSDFQAAIDLARRAKGLADEARRRALVAPASLPAAPPMSPSSGAPGTGAEGVH